MDCFEKFDPIDGDVPFYPFFNLFDVAWKARQFLDGMSRRDIRWIELEVDRTIEEMRDLAERLDRSAEGDSYDPDDELSEVEALTMALALGRIACDPGSPSESLVRCAAVLALMFVSSCLDTLQCPEEDLGTADEGPVAARLIPAANDAINAALALGLALTYEHGAYLEGELQVELEERLADFSKERARRAALKRHDATKAAKEFVRTEWAEHAAAYKCNKTDFARTYVELVRNKYRDKRGDPLKVTIKTITDVWLAPSASKPTGVPADG